MKASIDLPVVYSVDRLFEEKEWTRAAPRLETETGLAYMPLLASPVLYQLLKIRLKILRGQKERQKVLLGMMAFVHKTLYPCRDSRHIPMGSYVFHTWFFNHTHTYFHSLRSISKRPYANVSCEIFRFDVISTLS